MELKEKKIKINKTNSCCFPICDERSKERTALQRGKFKAYELHISYDIHICASHIHLHCASQAIAFEQTT